MFPSLKGNCILIGVCLFGLSLIGTPRASAYADSSLYTISDAQDLVAFSEAVNAGESFSGETVVLTADIDLSGCDFSPIGEFGTPYIFKGVFDGGGHTVSGICLTDETRTVNNGFFGQLGGTVKNLTVEGYLSGNCVGGIASHTAGYAQIVNCAAYVTIDANRGGGIADNFANGDLMGCYDTQSRIENQRGRLHSNVLLYGKSGLPLRGERTAHRSRRAAEHQKQHRGHGRHRP